MINWQPGLTIDIIEKSAIQQAIKFYQGNKTATAQALGIAIRTLDAKLEKYKEDADELQRRAEKNKSDTEKSIFNQQGKRAGLQAESFTQDAAKQSMPLPKREEVQSVPSQSTHRSNTNHRR